MMQKAFRKSLSSP